MYFIALFVALILIAHPLHAEKKPHNPTADARVAKMLGTSTHSYEPFDSPEELNHSFYESYAWRFEHYESDFCYPEFYKVFKAHWHFAPGADSKEILDIGAGPGYASRWMFNQGHQVECVVQRRWFEHYCKKKGAPVTLSSLREFRPTKRYDMVVGLYWPFNHIRPEHASQQIARISNEFLKPGGLFIAAIYMGCSVTYEDPEKVGHKRSFVHYTDEQWRSMIRPYFEVVSARELYLDSVKKDARIFVLRNKALSRSPILAA